MRKTRLGSRSSAWQARDTLDKDLRKYLQDTGQDYYFDKQQLENERNEFDDTGFFGSIVDHFKDNWIGSTIGGVIGAGMGSAIGPIGAVAGGGIGVVVGSNTHASDIANSLRGIADRWTGGKISADKHNLGLLSRENEDLAKIKDYINLVEQYKTELDDNKAAEILKKILEYDEYFMGEGRSHAPIAQLMFDINRIPDEYRTGAKTAEFLEYVRSNKSEISGMKKPQNISDLWDNFTTGLTDVSNIFGNAVASVTASVSYLANKVDADKYISNKALMSGAGKKDDFMSPYLKMMYRGGNSAKDIEEEVDNWIKYNENKGKELTWDLKANEWARINGMSRVPFSRHIEQIWNEPKKLLNLVPFIDSPGWSPDGGAWLNVWDPEDMSEEWKRAQKEHAGQFWHPLYMLPELGSTLGLAQGMVQTMTLNAASLYIINKIPTVAKALAGKDKFVKYGAKILSSVPYLLTAVRSGEIATTFDILGWQREIETSQEAEEGVSSRLLNLAFEPLSGVDARKVMLNIQDYVQNKLGIDTSQMEPQDLIGYATAFDIDTGDPVFEDSKKKSLLGLNKLMNANNALALHDYIETIPWLSYGGHVMEKFSKMMFDSMSKYYVPIRPAYMPMASRKGFGKKAFGSYWQSPNKLWNDIRTNWENEITARALSRANPAVNKLAQEYADAMYFARNSVLDNIAGRFINKDRIIRGLTLKHVGDHLKGIAKRSLITGIVEGLEEGQQQVLQQRFQEGLYDDYTTPYSLFNIPESIQNIELGKYSIEALFGMHDHGDDEIRKAMAIGFFISPLMGGAINVASNVSSSRQYDNLRNLIGQLRTDRVVGNMVGNNFKDREDYEHMSLFYEALSNHNVPIDRLVRSLNDLKLGVDERNSLVEKKYIDDDIRHAIAINTLYNSEDHKKALKEKGIEEGTELYKNAVIQNAKVLVDTEDELRNLIDKKQDKIKYIIHVKDTVSKLNDPSVPEEVKQELRDENPEIVLTLSQIGLFYDKYVSAINDWKSLTLDARKRGFDSLTNKQLASLTHPNPESGTWLSVFLGTSTTVDAGEALLESDDEAKQEFVEFLLNQDPTLNKDKFIDQILTMWEVNVALNKARLLRNDLSQHRDKHLIRFRKLTGKDIDIFKINGYVDSIDDIVAEQEKLEELYITWLEGVYNYDKKNSMLRTATLNDFFSGEMDLPLDNEGSFSDLVAEEIMHNAAFDNLNILRNAILNLESTTPQQLSNVINGIDKADDVFKALIEEYKKLEEEEKLDLLDRREGFDIRAEKQKVRRKAALEYLMQNAKDAERRKYIAHQGIISDEIDEISEDDTRETVLDEESSATEDTEKVVVVEEEKEEEPKEAETPATESKEEEEETVEDTEEKAEDEETEEAVEENEDGLPEGEDEEQEQASEEEDEEFRDNDDYENDTNPRGEEEEDTSSYQDNYDDTELPQELQEDNDINSNDANNEEDPHRNDANQEGEDAYRNDANQEDKETSRNDVPIDTDDYLDFEFLDYLNDTWLYNGEELDPSRINPLLAMQLHLVNLAQGSSAAAYDSPGRSHDANDIQTMSDLGYSKNLLSLTFFYNPDPRKKDGSEDTTPTILRHKGVDLKLKYKLGTSRQLAKRLLDKGFFENATKYYVVTIREEVQKYIDEHPELSEQEKKDLYTVALVIEDEENKVSYATFLRDLGTFETEVPTTNPITGELIKDNTHMRKVDNNQERMEEYEQHGIRRANEDSKSVAAKINNQAAGNLIAMWKLSNNETLSRETALNYVQFKYTLKRNENESEDSYNKRVQSVRSAILLARQTARQQLKIKGKKILTYSEIDYMIDKLRNNRNIIIDAYTAKVKRANLKDGDVITTVTPLIAKISNGRFDNISRNEGDGIYVPVLRSVAREGNPFGVGTTVAELSKQIFDGEIKLGYGTGQYFTNAPFNIIDIRSDHQEAQYSKGGIAGKIFLTVTTVNNTRIPMMLIELKLNTLHGKDGKKLFIQSPSDVLLTIDPNTGKITSKDYNPSIAEALLYMMFGRLSSEHIPGDPSFAKDTQMLLADFIVNNGTKTLLANEKIEKMLPYYAAKQLSIKDGVLSIGMPVLKNGLPTGEYHVTKYKEDEIFSNQAIRKDIVAAIATLMHWNTEKSVMELKFGDTGTERLVDSLMLYFQNNNEDLVSICGIPELTFKKDELFESGRNGKPRRVIPNTMIASWLIINEKLTSDVSDDVFYAPFVFADGVNEDPIVLDDNSDDTVVDLLNILNNVALVQSVKGYNEDATKFIVGDDIYKEKVSDVDAAKNTERYKAHGSRIKTVLLDMSSYRKDKYTSKEDFINDVKEKAQGLISVLNEHKDDLRLREGVSILLGDRIYLKALAESAMKSANGDRDSKKAIPVVDVHEDGTALISFFSYSGIGSASSLYVNGVFSTERQSSSINEEEARQWLANTLGIENRNILITDAVLKSVLDDDVYGMMELVYDGITRENEAHFVFRRQGGNDLEFHEAWHYVNLLIHDAKTRQALWDEYAKEKGLHGKGLLYKEIEEDMADDYKLFERNLLDHPLSSKIKMFFKNVGEFLHIIKNRPAYEKVYYNIHRGTFKNAKLDRASVKEFKKRYNGVVFSLDVLGLNRTTADKMAPIVKDTRTFYKVSDAIVDYALHVFDITTADKLKYLVSENGFKELKEELEDLKENLDEQKAKLLLTFIDSPDAIFHAIASRFKDLGINVDLKKDNRKEAKEREKSTEPAFDRYQFSISKKAHAAFLTKLFMRQIPKSHWELDENGEEIYVEDLNDFIEGVRQYLSFDEAWNLITKNLYNCNSYSDIIVDKDGNQVLTEDGKVQYLPTSIRGMVKELAKSQAFFAALDKKLDQIEDNPILKPQIYATLNSQLPNMSFVSLRTQISTLKVFDELSEIGEEVPQEVIDALLKKQNLKLLADRTKKWELRNDNTLRAARNIPRDWSKSILLRGLISNTSKGPVISKEYSLKLLKMLADLKKLIDDNNSTINDVKIATVKLLLQMGIPADLSVLDFFLQLDFTRSGELFEKSTIKSHIDKMMCQKTAGSIGYFIAFISKNAGLPSFQKKVSGNNLKEAMSLDRMFVGTKLTSKISKLALAQNAIHPSTEEYAVRMPNGEMGYPNSQNNTASTETRLMNTTNGLRALDKMDDPYCAHSLICGVAKDFDDMTPESQKLKLNLCVGMDSDSTQEGVDYFGITALEDYLINMYVLDQDPTFGTDKENPTNNEFTHLVTPTMADKKTHYDIQCKRLRTVHDTVIWYMTDDMISTYVEKKYKAGFDELFRKDHPGIEKGFEFAHRDYKPLWLAFMDDSIKSMKDSNYSEIVDDPGFYFRKYSEDTIKIFTNYFKDELEALRLYYSKAYILKLKDDPNSRIDNLHGTFKDGRMLFDGNGGLFRYFYDIFSVGKYETDEKGQILKDENGDYIPKANLNQWLEALWNIQKEIESGKAVDAKTGLEVGLTDVDDKLNLNNVEDVDGFELIRTKLDALYNKYFPNGIASEELKQAINRKLLLQTIEELKDISTNTNRLLAVESGGVYFPYSIPSMFLQRQNQRLYDNGHMLGKKSYVPYSKQSSMDDAQMLFSLMANHVANTAISILEYEKVYSGDPALYKYKYAEDRDTGERIKLKNAYTIRLGEKEIRVEIETDILSDKSTDKIKRLGSLQSPGDEIFTNYTPKDVPDEQERLYLNSKHYTNLTVRDFILESSVLESEIKPRFRKQLIIDYLRTNRIKLIHDLIKRKLAALKDKDAKYTFEHLVQDIYSNNHGIEDEVIEILKKLGAYERITKEIKGQSKPFGKVNVSDAQVLLRPAFYRKIRKGLGLWSDELEEAYQILENDPDWMKKPELIEKVSKAEFYPLKMSYFNTESHEFGKGMYINRTILNKLACFPWFKYFAQSDTGRDIYNRMNKEGHEIDQLSFESAVKVGSMQNSPYVYDENKNKGKVLEIGKLGEWVNKLSASKINLEKDEEEAAASGDVLPVVVQDLTFLRYQLNTESHEDDYRAIGTQVFKIMFQNLFDKAVYGLKAPYGKEIKGEHLKTDILACIDALTLKGIDHLHNDYYYQDKNGRFIPSDDSIQKYVEKIVRNLNLGIVAENIIANGYVAECLTNRAIFEQNAVAKVNEEVIDINTQGGTAIQQSMFGFNDYTEDSVAWDGSYAKYNNGRPLRWHRDDGSIEVMLSLNFFRNVIPDYENKTQEQRRQWLFDNGIIGRDSKPFGIAYRIPTQGLSSAFAMTVVDVLPNVSGDLIVLPPEITSQTGSDYDVDKMFIATLNYEDGKLIDVPEIDNKLSLQQKRKEFYKLTEKLIQNKLLFDYLSIITDVKSYAASRKSIDTIVSRLKDLFLDQIEPKTSKYVLGMQELLPSFQSDRKLEFKTGKDGIGPFALSITNLTLMQAVHLTMLYNDSLKEYGFLDLDETYSKDGSYIQDWLSAMVSAHVDVAKDPYIFKLNVNKVTYNHTSFLLRSGMGISTFSFLAQPILKTYANLVMLSGGIYGRMLTGSEVVNISRSKRARLIKGGLYEEYINKIKLMVDQAKDTEFESELSDIYKHALTYSSRTNLKGKKFSKNEKKASEYIDRSEIFDFEKGVAAIKNSVSTASIVDLAKSALFNIQCLYAFEEISKPADALSELILTSRIDTEGFGNTIATLMNFDSKLKSLKYQGNSNWIIKGASPELNSTPGYALKTYFENTYLENKFYTAHSMTMQLLRRLLLSATTPYRKIFDGVGRLLNGESVLHKVQYEKDSSTGRWVPKVKKNPVDGTVQYVTEEEKIFKAFYKDDSAQAVGNAIDNIARFNILMNYYKYVEQLESNRKKISDREHGIPVDLSIGGDITKVLQKIRTLLLGSNEVKSLPMRFNEFFEDILNNPDADYAEGLVDRDGVSNEFLRFLLPISKNPSKNQNIDYFSLHESAIRSSDYYKQRVISDFGALLNHPSERVRELATDLVFYAYYTSYDTPGRNKFFSLVPPYYRSVYDDIIKQALVGSNRLSQFALFSTPYEMTSSANILAEEYVDIIARNYWYDDTIVQKMFENTNLNREEPGKESKAYEYRPDKFYWTNRDNHQKYPGLIITTNMLYVGSPTFAKITKSGYTVLYKKVGTLRITKQSTTGDGAIEYKSHCSPDIYMAVEKAGIWSNGTYLPEFFKTRQIPSIFEQNKLPGNFHEGRMWQFLYDLLDKKNTVSNGKQPLFKYEVKKTERELDLDDKQLDIYYQSTYTGYVPPSEKKVMKTSDGSIIVDMVKQASPTILNFATKVISLESNSYNDVIIPGDKRLDISNVFDSSGNINIDAVLKQIANAVNSMNDDEKSKKNRIIINLPEEKIPVTEEENSTYIDRAENWYVSQNPDASEEEIEQYSNFIKSAAADQIKLIKMYQLSDLIIKSLSLNGYNIELLLAARLTQNSRAALTAASDNSELIGNPMGAQKALFRVTPTDLKTTYDSFLELLNAGIDAYTLEIPGVDYLMEAHEETLELVDLAEEEVEEKKEKARQEKKESDPKQKSAKPSQKPDFSKMTPEQILEYVMLQAASYGVNTGNSNTVSESEKLPTETEEPVEKEPVLKEEGTGMTYEEAKKLTPAQVASLSPEQILEYVNAMRNRFVNENGNKIDRC